jgi:hypothetical protein
VEENGKCLYQGILKEVTFKTEFKLIVLSLNISASKYCYNVHLIHFKQSKKIKGFS